MPIEHQAYPRPVSDDPLETKFWELCQGGELKFQCCSACGAWRSRPRYMCSNCGSPRFDWLPVEGNGKVYSWTVTYQPFHPAFGADVPYISAVVELAEGMRMATRLFECSDREVYLGMSVTLTFKDLDEGFQLPCFRPVSIAERTAP